MASCGKEQAATGITLTLQGLSRERVEDIVLNAIHAEHNMEDARYWPAEELPLGNILQQGA